MDTSCHIDITKQIPCQMQLMMYNCKSLIQLKMLMRQTPESESHKVLKYHGIPLLKQKLAFIFYMRQVDNNIVTIAYYGVSSIFQLNRYLQISLQFLRIISSGVTGPTETNGQDQVLFYYY